METPDLVLKSSKLLSDFCPRDSNKTSKTLLRELSCEGHEWFFFFFSNDCYVMSLLWINGITSWNYGDLFVSVENPQPDTHTASLSTAKLKKQYTLSSQELDFNCLFSLSWFMILMSSFPLAETWTGKSASFFHDTFL